ncbi:MAG: tocopherol cyclase family protein [Gammaproteobacteria bacterium]
MLKSFARIGFFLCFAAGAACAEDTFNTYQWNRPNYEADNGRIDRGDWYEWWYYKVVLPDRKEAFYFIYGVVNPWDRQQRRDPSRSYVAFGSFKSGVSVEKTFPVDQFDARYDQTRIQVADNVATDQSLHGAITADGHRVSWDLQIEHDWRFNAMGWLMPIREITDIFWYPAQASARMSGTVRLDGATIKLDREAAYQDRNWGRSFPIYWAWLVSNRFHDFPHTVLAAGGGKPKVLGRFPVAEGLSIGLKHAGQEFIFRPMDGDYVDTDIRFGKWEATAINKKGEKVVISAFAPKEKFKVLKFITPQGTVFYDYEALQGRIDVSLYRRKKWWFIPYWSLIAKLRTDAGGIEFGSPDIQDIDAYFASSFTLH